MVTSMHDEFEEVKRKAEDGDDGGGGGDGGKVGAAQKQFMDEMEGKMKSMQME
jgi:hypothetical protein